MVSLKHILAAAAILAAPFGASADYTLQWRSELSAQAGSGTFAPYYIASRCDGVAGAAPYAFYTRDAISREMNDSSRFSYGFGVDLMAGYVSPIDYERYDPVTATLRKHPLSSGYFYPQQIYGEVKYRSLFLMAGMKSYDRSLFDNPLGSGDFVISNNARPIPQVRLGFLDFTDVPLTKGWLQVQGELAYGKFVDNGWLERQASRLNSFVTTGAWMHYKRLYFRIAPRERFTFTVGMQHAAQFGGTKTVYLHGREYSREKARVTAKSFFDILIPGRGEGSAYYDGNHLGSWDLTAQYRSPVGTFRLTAQFPWEDGSGIGKLNGWDGIWGLEYTAPTPGIVDAVTVQYIDMMNQSGPMHWAPGDFPGTAIPGEATGADNYYNNYFYDGWANYGMSIGSPFFKSPVYNTDGFPIFTDNRMRGFHVGVSGTPARRWQYREHFSYRTSWGSYFLPAPELRHDTSMLVGATWQSPAIEGLSVRGEAAFDCGKLYGDNFGVRVSVEYSGDITFKKKK